MKSTRIAQRYARALFDLSQSLGKEDGMAADMQLLAATIGNSKELKNMLASPVIKPERKRTAMNGVFSAHLDKLTLDYINIIIRKKREMHLQGIAQRYIEIYRSEKGILTARLATAASLSAEMCEAVRKLVSEQLQASIELETRVKPELIGGYVLEVEGRRYETSLRSKLNSLIREFNINIYEKKL